MGDIVAVLDKQRLGKPPGIFKIGRVSEIRMGADGRVRSCAVSYRHLPKNLRKYEYRKGPEETITRSVHNLVLLESLDEQEAVYRSTPGELQPDEMGRQKLIDV